MSQTIQIQYRYTLPNGQFEVFDLKLDANDGRLLNTAPAMAPEWAQLTFQQCNHCPLDSKQHKYCPMALHLIDVVERTTELGSQERVYVDVTLPDRTIYRHTTAQNGLSAMIGLISATCGCPHTVFFRPMARFHLPMASVDETVLRATSMYLLAQYFRKQQGLEAQLDLGGLQEIYQRLEVINLAMIERLKQAQNKRHDASAANAFFVLSVFSQAVPLNLEESLQPIKSLFAPYLT